MEHMSSVTPYQLYKQILLIRSAEEKLVELYPLDKIQGPVHLGIGQEAASVGVLAACRTTDFCYATYRGHAAYLAKGGSLNEFFAELYGKETGCCKGRGGSMHLSYPKARFMGTSAIVGSLASVAAGTALASKMQKTDDVTVVFLGDGAFDEGYVHEALDFSILHRLPILFVCEDNGLAVHSTQEKRRALNILHLCAVYKMDRNILEYTSESAHNIFELFGKTTALLTEIRSKHKVGFLHVKTFRAMEHVGIHEDFDSGYRDRPHVVIDALDVLGAYLTEEIRAAIAQQVKREIEIAVEFAENSNFPDVNTLLENIYA
jgi:pyruvate dehydrogenase E1 component alpha subunit